MTEEQLERLAGAKRVKIKWATAPGSFLPFTALTKAYPVGRIVALVLLTPEEVEALQEPPSSGPGSSPSRSSGPDRTLVGE